MSVVAAAVTGPDRPEPPQEVPRHKGRGRGSARGTSPQRQRRRCSVHGSGDQATPRCGRVLSAETKGGTEAPGKGVREWRTEPVTHHPSLVSVTYSLTRSNNRGTRHGGGHGDTAKEQPASVSPLWRVGLEA